MKRSFAKPQMKKNTRRRKKTNFLSLSLKYLLPLLSLLFCTTLCYKAYKRSKPVDIDNLLLIQNSRTNFKTKPEYVSGMIVQHQNKTIYDALNTTPEVVSHDANKRQQLQSDNLLSIQKLYFHDQKISDNTSNAFDVMAKKDTPKNQKVVILFGEMSTKAAAETRIEKLSKTYQELTGVTFLIKQDKKHYKLQTNSVILPETAKRLCEKITKLKEACNVKIYDTN